MTGAAAARLGLRQRGLLRDGMLADIVVFDPATVRSNATYDEPRRFPDGIEHVMVNGTLVVDDGAHTGATPGRGIRLGPRLIRLGTPSARSCSCRVDKRLSTH